MVAPLDGKKIDGRRNNGRTDTGFKKGCPGGPGNPFSKKTNQLRAALIKTVTKEDVREIALKLIAEAKKGEMPAVHELFNRIFGKANQPMEITASVDSEQRIIYTFDHDRFSELFFRSRAPGIAGPGDGTAPQNGN